MSAAAPQPVAIADALVMFGLTGDLGHKKLFPAVYELAASGILNGPVVGVGRTEYTDDDLRRMFDEAMTDAHLEVDADVMASIDLSYVSGDSTKGDTYVQLAHRLAGCELPVIYGALPPDLHVEVARQVAASDLPASTRLVTEKPFGTSVESARELWASITEQIDAERVFIVDHFLAKAAIENMSTVRLNNALIDNSMCAERVSAIDVVMSESGGVDGRGSFYESVGAIDDVLQNHLLQAVAYITMEAPADRSDAAMAAARLEALRSIRPADPTQAVVGQYDGYREVDDVADDSEVETFVSLVLYSDAERWRDVPIRITTGKELRADLTEVSVRLRDTAPADGSIGNVIRFGVKPHASVSFDLAILDPDSHDAARTTVMACTTDEHGRLGDYAVMLDNALRGERRHFADIDAVIEAWRIVAPLKDTGLPLTSYARGSDGPPTLAG